MNHDGEEEVNEMSTVAFYYKLYRLGPQNSSKPLATNDDRDCKQQDDGPTNIFWEDDEWTGQEEQDALQILADNRERCSMQENGVVVNTSAENDEHAWNQFYSQHQTNFFKDRHYLHKAFPNEFSYSPQQPKERTLVEIGCGVGNALLPLLEETKEHDDKNNDTVADKEESEYKWTVHGIDLSKVAIDWLQQDARFVHASKDGRAYAYVCDISLPSPDNNSPISIPQGCQGVADVATLLFCLSAIPPGARMQQAVLNVAATLQPSGVLVFRDYGRFDEAQMKLGTSRNKLLEQDNFYRKHDGTKCYYFSLEDVQELFEQYAGLQVLELKYLRRAYRNRSTNEIRRRVWVQGRFRKVV